MNIFTYLKQIYSGKNALRNHICIFSLIGVVATLLCKYFAPITNLYYIDFYIAPLETLFEKFLILFILSFIVIYFIGYIFKFNHRMFCMNNAQLSEVNLNSYWVFIKMLPLLIVWKIYFIVVGLLVSYVVYSYSLPMWCIYLFVAALLFIIPFIFLVFVKFSKGFKYKSDFFRIITLFKFLYKSFWKILNLNINMFILTLMILFVQHWIYSTILGYIPEVHDHLRLGVYLGGFCITGYTLFVLNLLYNAGMVNIVKKSGV